jgi:hypothetical protein
MKLLISGIVLFTSLAAGVASSASAQEPAARTERVVHIPEARVSGARQRPTDLILPPPTNVYERATRRDRARDTGAPSTRTIRRDL